jgi:hypothetical protein
VRRLHLAAHVVGVHVEAVQVGADGIHRILPQDRARGEVEHAVLERMALPGPGACHRLRAEQCGRPGGGPEAGGFARCPGGAALSAGTGPTWSQSWPGHRGHTSQRTRLATWATYHDDPPACRVARLQGDVMPMPAHQDGPEACGQFLREMRWSHLVPVMPGPANSVTEPDDHRNREASGSVNRLLRPDSVRHMSVTTAMQGLTAAHHDTQRDNSNAARKPGYAQATGPRPERWCMR